jgi:hypothetical protein
MTILKIYDTILEAKNNAVNDYRDYIIRELGAIIRFNGVHHPYKIKIDDDCYVYAANDPRYLLGMRFNKIEDYTRSGVCDEIKACEYESKN